MKRRPLVLSPLVLAGVFVVRAPCGAQAYYEREYAEVLALTGEAAADSGSSSRSDRLRIWLTLHLAGAGYLITIDGAGEEARGRILQWSDRRDHVDDQDCAARLEGRLVSVCVRHWRPGVSPTELVNDLENAGLFPLPDISQLPPRAPKDEPPATWVPCPDDGWHLWVQSFTADGEGEIEYCIYAYRWPDRRVANRAIELIRRFVARAAT